MTVQTQQPAQIPQRTLKLHALDPRRKSVLILASLIVTITAIAVATTLNIIGAASPSGLTALNITALVATLATAYIIIRLGARITELEFWIRRMGAGDLEHTVPPRGHDELTEIAYDLEVLRERSIRSQELDLVRQLSEELQDKNGELENTLVELRNTQDQMISKQKLAEIGELAAGIAHEVRNPLNIISNYSATSRSLMDELLEVLGEEDTDHEYVNEITTDLTQNMTRIGENCDRASRIIQDVTNMSRSAKSEQRPVELNKMLHDYAILAYQATRARDQSFNVTIEERLDDAVGDVMCVPEEISRVFINIASNGCYATNQKRLDPDTPDDYKPTMTLATRRKGENIVVSIRDNGNGIPDDVRDKIFNPFFTTKPTNEGTGLGLSLSHEIIRRHGGDISADSQPGLYTEMSITLPSRPAATAGANEHEAHAETQATQHDDELVTSSVADQAASQSET